VPFSPLGRGLLTGAYRGPPDFKGADFRTILPRFQPGAFEHNLAALDRLAALAEAKGCSAAQLAVAWVLARGPHVVPIPGTRRLFRLTESGPAGGASGEARLAERVLSGFDGVLLRSPEGTVRLLAAKKVYCPTELGGMMGYLAQRDDFSPETLKQAMAYGILVASFNVEDFSLDRLKGIDRGELDLRMEQYKKMLSF